MEDQYNLIYNGKMLHGMDGYLTSNDYSIDTSDKPSGCAASYSMNVGWPQTITGNIYGITPIIPYINADTYTISCKIKNNGTTQSYSYGVLTTFDNKGKYISINETCPYEPNGSTITTLAQDLNNGDTTIYLADASKWTADTDYRIFGIIESAAYKDGRAIAYQYLAQNGVNTTNNTIILSTAWTYGTYKAGSKVREFTRGTIYLYPFQWHNNIPSDWSLILRDFSISNPISDGATRLPFTYFLGLSFAEMKAKVADLRFENLSRPQARIPMNMQNEMPVSNIAPYTESTSSVNQYGQLNTSMLSEGFLPVRYIRDWGAGSVEGSNSMIWQEIQAFDRWGRNVAFAADGTIPSAYHIIYDGVDGGSRGGLNKVNTTTFKPMHAITKGYVDGNRTYIDNWGNPNGTSVTIDMGIVHYINKIIVWHYIGTTRHNTKTEVSVDGVNWVTVFDSAIEGEYQEISTGHTITFDKLGTLYYASMKKGGETLVQDIIED